MFSINKYRLQCTYTYVLLSVVEKQKQNMKILINKFIEKSLLRYLFYFFVLVRSFVHLVHAFFVSMLLGIIDIDIVTHISIAVSSKESYPFISYHIISVLYQKDVMHWDGACLLNSRVLFKINILYSCLRFLSLLLVIIVTAPDTMVLQYCYDFGSTILP